MKLASSKAEWLRNLLANIPLIKDVLPHVSIHSDCQVAFAIAKNKSLKIVTKPMQLDIWNNFH